MRNDRIAERMATGWIAAQLIPVFWLVVSSFRPATDLLKHPFQLPSSVTVQNYSQIFHMPGFLSSLASTLESSLLASSAAVMIGLPAAYGLSMLPKNRRRMIEKALAGTYLLASTVLGLAYYQGFSAAGLIGTVWGLSMALLGLCLPLAILFCHLILASVPLELGEVATVCGIRGWWYLTRVIVPMNRERLSALLFLLFLISWREFFLAFLIGGSGSARTLSVLLASLYGGEAINWHLLTAFAVLLAAPPALLLLLRSDGLAFAIRGSDE